MSDETMDKATWTAAFVNDLPDAAFAIVKPGGKKDDDGKTVPRALRMLPHHNGSVTDPNDNDSVDKPHLRAALARVAQPGTDLTPAQRARASAHLQRHAKAVLAKEDVTQQAKALSLSETVNEVYNSFRAQFPYQPAQSGDGIMAVDTATPYVVEIWSNYVVARKGYKLFRVDYSANPDADTDPLAPPFHFVDESVWQEVEQGWTPVKRSLSDGEAAPELLWEVDGDGPMEPDAEGEQQKAEPGPVADTEPGGVLQRLSNVVPGLERLLAAFQGGEKAKAGQDGDTASLRVFKQKDGSYRWVTISNTAIEDKEDEIVSRKALDAGIAKADETGERGTLDFWHVDGADLGDCDFQAREGYALVESGTFRNTKAGRAAAKEIAAHPERWAVSIQFRFPPAATHMVKNAAGKALLVYDEIQFVNRTVLPVGKEASRFTSIASLGGQQNMEKHKLEALATLVGGDAVDEVLGQAQAAGSKASAAGFAMKDAEDAEAQQEATETEPSTDGPSATPAGVTPLEGTGEGAELAPAATAPEVDITVKAITELTNVVGEAVKTLQTASARIEALENKVKEMEAGNLPRLLRYRASQDPAQATKDGEPFQAPKSEVPDILKQMADRMMAGMPR